MNPRRDYIFNSIAGIINAGEAVVMMMVVTRTADLSDAGYLTIAFAVGNLLMCIGKWGVYNYLVTDTVGQFGFCTYLHARIITVLLMLISLAVYLIYGHVVLGYSTNKMIVIVAITLIYTIECVEDLFISLCQHIGCFWRGSLMFITRWTGILTVFGVIEALTGNTVTGLLASLCVSVIIFGVNLAFTSRPMASKRDESILAPRAEHLSLTGVFSLLKACFPVFMSAFLSFYISNASKYALERYFDADILACYGFVAMPVFAIGLLSGFVYRPQLVPMSVDYSAGRIGDFKKRIFRQFAVISALTLVCVVGARIIGVPVLSWLYQTDLAEYRTELVILVLAGGFLALSSYQSVVLTIIRKQQFILYGYAIVSILAMSTTWYIVRHYGVSGAAWSYLALMVLLCTIYMGFLKSCIRGR